MLWFSLGHIFYKLSCTSIYSRENVFTKKRAKCGEILTHCCNCQHPAKRSSDSTELFWEEKKQNRNLTASKMRSSGILSKYCQKQYQFLPKVFHFKWIGMILWKIRKNIFYSNSFAYKMIVALQLLVNL